MITKDKNKKFYTTQSEVNNNDTGTHAGYRLDCSRFANSHNPLFEVKINNFLAGHLILNGVA
jgi:hypothetical protein